jgi:hypothetical protein
MILHMYFKATSAVAVSGAGCGEHGHIFFDVNIVILNTSGLIFS